MVFQEYNLVERLTVIENVLSGRLGYMTAWNAWRRNYSAQDLAKAFRYSNLWAYRLCQPTCRQFIRPVKDSVLALLVQLCKTHIFYWQMNQRHPRP